MSQLADAAGLAARLREVEPHRCISPDAAFSRWHRNPDGPEAADLIETLIKALQDARESLTRAGM